MQQFVQSTEKEVSEQEKNVKQDERLEELFGLRELSLEEVFAVSAGIRCYY